MSLEQLPPQPIQENDSDFRIDMARLCHNHTIDVLAGVVLQTTSAGLRIGGVVIESLELTESQKDNLTDKMMYVVKKWMREEGLIT